MTDKKQETGQVSGYAKGDGKVVHIIVDDVFTLCDRKREMLPEDDKTVNNVSCKKCMRGAVYKGLIQAAGISAKEGIEVEQPKKEAAGKINPSDHSDAEKAAGATHKDIKKEAAAKKKKQTPKKEVTKKKKPKSAPAGKKKDSKPIKETKEEKPELPLNDPAATENKEEPDKNQLLMLANMLSSIKGQFMAEMKANFTYRIKHVAGDRIFFDGVKHEVVSQALLLLNNIKESWDGKALPSQEFLSKARLAFGQAHKLAGCDYPESLQKEADKKKQKQAADEKDEKKSEDKPEPKKTLTRLPKRRKKKDKKEATTKLPRRRQKRDKEESASATLPRRRKKTETLFGKRAGTPIYSIANAIKEKPIRKATLLELLKKEHGMDDKRAKSKFASTIRVLTRRVGVIIQIIQMKNEFDDIYFIPKTDANPTE
ncbi:MAG: hypothetical protein PVG39_00600 [Desulfobacteraceae bacterium]|jgi:hypothetical protein